MATLTGQDSTTKTGASNGPFSITNTCGFNDTTSDSNLTRTVSVVASDGTTWDGNFVFNTFDDGYTYNSDGDVIRSVGDCIIMYNGASNKTWTFTVDWSYCEDGVCSSGGASGDSHITTLDGHKYDL